MKTNANMQVQSFLAVIKKRPQSNDINKDVILSTINGNASYISGKDNQIQVAYNIRNVKDRKKKGVSDKNIVGCIVLGDNNEHIHNYKQPTFASSTVINYCLENNSYIKVYTSIVGLPPVFMYEHSDYIILSSDLYLITSLPVDIEIDQKGVHEFYSIGHPVGGRTLFSNISLLPGGYCIEIRQDGHVKKSRAWQLPEIDHMNNWSSYVDLQTETLENAMKSIDLSNSFLSMTAGLDTRAIFAALIQQDMTIPTCTMTSRNISLDAKTAHRLCEHYNFNHNLVYLDDEFYNELPSYVLKASQMSGGLSSLGQAHEVYYYTKTMDIGNSRISGNLGNQVCRCGVERITMRNAGTSFLNEQLFELDHLQNDEHWFSGAEGGIDGFDYEFLLQKEVPYTSVGNYCIGNHFATQQTPYANRNLIENLQRMPKTEDVNKKLSPSQIRLRDLMHRFFGHSKSSSFQIKLINDTGGYVASYPINWGWRAKGGVSVKGIFNGSLAFIDAAASSKGLDTGNFARILDTLKIQGLHEYTRPRIWLKTHLKEFVLDLFATNAIKHSGIFNNANIQSVLSDFYSLDNYDHKELIAALDIALVHYVFLSRECKLTNNN